MRSKLLMLLFSVLFGSAVSAQSLYVVISPVPASKIGCLAKHFQKYDSIVGYSSLGHFFLRASTDNEYIVLHPFKKAAKSYGVFPNTKTFENKILKDEGFAEYVLRPEHVRKIQERLGPLKKDEIFIPRPYPFLGGSDKPETYGKGNVWVFVDIVAQMQGLCG